MSPPEPPTAPPERPPSRRGRRARVWLGMVAIGLLCVLTFGADGIVRRTAVLRPPTPQPTSTPATPVPPPPVQDAAGSALKIPPLARSTTDAQGRRVFDLDVRPGVSEFLPGRRTNTWGVNGAYLGPTLRAHRGETVQVRVRNSLPEATTMHWHGMQVPAGMDGGPHQMIEPGATWSPTWRVDQPAATLWYHPHAHGATGEQIYRGVSGMFIVDDDSPAARALPHDYGVDDLPVIVQDRSFDSDGQFDQESGTASPIGWLGGTILVNGTRSPYQRVTTERVRLRLLNASAARVYDFGFDDGRRFAVVGSDGGLLAGPAVLDRIQLSPGERAEVVVTMRPGERTVLRGYPPDLGTAALGDGAAGGDSPDTPDTLDILSLRAAPRLRSSPRVPAALADVPAPRPGAAAAERRFELAGVSINGRTMDPDRIDLAVTRSTTEVWSVANVDAVPHNFHVHGMRFRVLDIEGRAPPPQLRGWKDTVFLAPDTTTRLVITFPDYADPNLPYMFHCHLLQHEDLGMMGQFVVVAPGQKPGRPPDVQGDDRGDTDR